MSNRRWTWLLLLAMVPLALLAAAGGHIAPPSALARSLERVDGRYAFPGTGADGVFQIAQQYDYGDAPAPYPPLARHRVSGNYPYHFGTSSVLPDVESGAQPHPDALGDDLAGYDDEQGVSFPKALLVCHSNQVVVQAWGPSNRRLNAWIDYNDDGDWADSGEQVFTNTPLPGVVNVLNFNVPCNAVPTDKTFARFRISDTLNLSYSDANPNAASIPYGEVEDLPAQVVECCLNVMFVMDVSPSMTGALPFAKIAAINFVNSLNFPRDQAGVVSFADNAVLEIGLNTNKNAIIAAINGMTIRNATHINRGIDRAKTELIAHADPDCKNVMILISDGDADNNGVNDLADVASADAAKGAPTMARIITVAVGSNDANGVPNIRADHMRDLSSPGWNFVASDPAMLPTLLAFFAAHKCNPTVPPNFDLEIQKVGLPVVVPPKGDLNYTVTVHNWGTMPAENVVVIDTLPAVYDYIDSSSSQGSPPTKVQPFATTHQIRAELGTMAPNGVATIWITGTVPCTPITQTLNAADVTTTTAGELSLLNNHDEFTNTLLSCYDLEIEKSDNPDPVNVGGQLTYVLDVTNHGPGAAAAVFVHDTLPAAVNFISAVPTVGNCVFTPVGRKLDCALGAMAPLAVAQIVVTTSVEDGSDCVISNTASVTSTFGTELYADLYTGNDEDTETTMIGGNGCQDVGDAPDSTNHYWMPMTAYPGIAANFPSVFDANTGLPVGPHHQTSRGDIFLGDDVSAEDEADLLPDEDGVTNIDPTNDFKNQDQEDDGVIFPLQLPDCGLTHFTYGLTVADGPHPRYVNAWFDFNRDGDWDDTLTCTDPVRGVVQVPEWTVANHAHTLAPGHYTFTTPDFNAFDPNFPNETTWMRILVSEDQFQDGPTYGSPPDGQGPKSGLDFGETEDYYLHVENGNYVP